MIFIRCPVGTERAALRDACATHGWSTLDALLMRMRRNVNAYEPHARVRCHWDTLAMHLRVPVRLFGVMSMRI
jgi:hypothetical protein